MRLFLKDHQMLVGFYVLQMLLVPCVYWLSGEGRPMKIVLYGMLISTVVLMVYLIIRYFQLRAYYHLLEQPRKLVNEPFQTLGNSVVAEAVQQLLHELERNRQNEIGQLRTSKEQQVVFMNRWVHQMKTPLSIIQLTLEDVEDKTAGSIQDELDKMRKGLEMVLHSSRLEQFEGDFRVELLSLHEVLRSSIAENRRLFIRRGITPDIRIEEDLQIYSDSKWLRFMFTQILTNAVNYSDSKSGKKVIITGYKLEERTILDIQDEGIGISSEDIHRVFNPYFTGERGRQYHESTGMGLYLVREISARLDNRVELFSEPNEGTLVRFSWVQSKYPK
ncbi:Signal transduction histidine kinase [Paenibacillus sp. CF095]|uniref:sensor histidine kinase n=1 Tax=Paenibacillus sp. CF095 TaxID=1881033 RepID=UPI0008824C2F|nr:sensor histidine kinase [Paenibacillus sp. CF095]SDC43923.1 Signal transduction histidine kinase [Paenibacillus sp. CF095]